MAAGLPIRRHVTSSGPHAKVESEPERALGAGTQPLRAACFQLSKKLRSLRERLGCLSLRSALASIWRIRSRVTENC